VYRVIQSLEEVVQLSIITTELQGFLRRNSEKRGLNCKVLCDRVNILLFSVSTLESVVDTFRRSNGNLMALSVAFFNCSKVGIELLRLVKVLSTVSGIVMLRS
jgi:hypothetical protein